MRIKTKKVAIQIPFHQVSQFSPKATSTDNIQRKYKNYKYHLGEAGSEGEAGMTARRLIAYKSAELQTLGVRLGRQ